MKKLTFTIIFSFYSLLLLGQSYDFMGVSSCDGQNSNGFIYRYNNGNLEHVYDFLSVDNNGKNPNNLIKINGTIYGTTTEGGTNNGGVIFTVNPTNLQITPVYNFDRSICSKPTANIVKYNGKIYGYAQNLSLPNQNNGSIYEYDPLTGNLNVLFTFSDALTQGNKICGLTVNNGIIYGLSSEGGENDDGTIFSFDINSNSFNVLHHFLYPDDGGFQVGVQPYTQPIVQNNILYGINSNGGSSVPNSGTIYKYNLINNQFQVIYNFDSNTVCKPRGRFVLINNKIYGLATSGGSNWRGGLFEYDLTTGQLTTLVEYPSGYYATTIGGVILHNNFLISIINSPRRKLSIYDLSAHTHSFIDFHQSQTNYASLYYIDNDLFFVDKEAGLNFSGNISTIDINTGNILFSYDFSVSPNGNEPYGRLTYASNGKYYGVTRKGGESGMYNGQRNGIIFEIDSNGNFQKIFDIPYNSLYRNIREVAIKDNYIYLTNYGGVTKIDINTHNIVGNYGFGSYTDTPMILASDGNLYGFLYNSHISELNTTTNYTHEFYTHVLHGLFCELMEYNGKIYGLTTNSCPPRHYRIFSFDISSLNTNILQDIYEDIYPLSKHMKFVELNSKLYISNVHGSLYEFNIATNVFRKVVDANYYNPFGQELLPIDNNHLLGTFGNKIVLYDIQNQTQQVIATLSPEIYTSYPGLIDYFVTNNINDKIWQKVNIYPNPTTDFVYIKSVRNISIKSINLIDIQGKRLLKDVKTDKIDLTKYKKGIYLLQLTTDSGKTASKVIIKQ